MKSFSHSPASVSGFSLVELMVALVAGMIVTGAVLAFTMSSLNTNTEYIQATRLTQELRSAIDFTSRELRRSGYDESAIAFYSQDLAPGELPKISKFSSIYIKPDAGNPLIGDCVIYAYDLGSPAPVGESPDRESGEIRAIRRSVVNGVGVIEVAQSEKGKQPTCDGAAADYATYPATCSADGWCAFTDPKILDIQSFKVDRTKSWDRTGSADGSISPIAVRALTITMSGALVGVPDVVRSVQTSIRVRSDCLQSFAECTSAPVGTN